MEYFFFKNNFLTSHEVIHIAASPAYWVNCFLLLLCIASITSIANDNSVWVERQVDGLKPSFGIIFTVSEPDSTLLELEPDSIFLDREPDSTLFDLELVPGATTSACTSDKTSAPSPLPFLEGGKTPL